ncbi:MAG: class I SAM-dependent methyltransferase, partial [Burkholderiaceae bacterium]
MTDWTAGYVADIGYTYGYYTELNPLRVRLAFLNAGLVPPEMGTACELGFGQGMSANLHAAASVVQWHGTDFNPSQAAFAQELALASGAGAQWFDEAFDQFCSRTDLPEFDYIGLHGIWSWISDENRSVIVDFLRRKLKVGGVLYISYNTQPGWAAMAPMRDLLTEHAEVLGADGAGIVNRIDSALAFVEQLLAANPLYARANPQIAERIQKIKEQNRHYVAHEYFNRDWQPMAFAKMAQWLESAKVQWACSAHYLDAIDAINLTAEQQALLTDIPDAMFRQTVRDFCVNQQFRKDYWVKGARPLSTLEQAELLRAERVILVQPRADVSMKVTGSIGEGNLHEAVYGPILNALANHKPQSLAQLEQAVKGANVSFPQLLQAVMILSGTGALLPAQDDALAGQVRKRTDRLNRHLVQKARGNNDLFYLASPLTGGGFKVSRFHQLFLMARANSHKQPADWAQYVWTILSSQGHRLVKD